MKKDAFERVNDLIDELVNEGYDRDEIISALELKLMALKEEDGEEE